jgi:DNA-binding beta-propeller fold protein YncE
VLRWKPDPSRSTAQDDSTRADCIGRARDGGGRTLRQIATIPLDRIEGRFDHFAIDRAGKRIFVAALGNNSVEVIDLATTKSSSPHRHERAAGRRVCRPTPRRSSSPAAATGKSASTTATRSHSNRPPTTSTTPTTSARDGKSVYVGYGSGAIAVFDGEKLIDRIKLSGHPESFQLEAKGERIFVNVPSAKRIEVIDRTKKSVIANWPITGAEANFPMVLDEPNHRLLIACRKPARLVVYDTDSGKLVAATEICGDADDLWLDSVAHRIYITGGEGSSA